MMKKIGLLYILLMWPLMLQAVSFGLVFPFGITENEDLSYGNIETKDFNYDYKHIRGLGYVLDTNVAEKDTFGYRMTLEYALSGLTKTNRPELDDVEKNMYSFVNTFTFGVTQMKDFRWWVGPRINVQIEHTIGSDIKYQNSFGFGLAAATGMNLMVAKRVALGADIDYFGNIMFGGESSNLDESVFFGTASGVKARLYLLFVFGEDDEKIDARKYK